MSQPRTLYIIPTDCPVEDRILVASPEAWQTIRFRDIVLLCPQVEDGFSMQFQLRPDLFLAWTCTGCTAAMGDFKSACIHRKCKLGGTPIDTP